MSFHYYWLGLLCPKGPLAREIFRKHEDDMATTKRQSLSSNRKPWPRCGIRWLLRKVDHKNILPPSKESCLWDVFKGSLYQLSCSCLILNCVKFLKLYLGQREVQFNKTETTAIPCSKFLRRSKYKMATKPTLSHSPQEMFPWSLLLSREKSLVCAKNSSTCCWPLYSFPSSSYSPLSYILNTQALLKLIGH